jgi:hypothetical protein
MPKDIVLMSESEIDGESVEECIRGAIRNIQDGLCKTETHLMRMIESDEINAEMWLASHEINVGLRNLITELIDICKEIRPSGKALKVARDNIDKMVDEFKQSGLN